MFDGLSMLMVEGGRCVECGGKAVCKGTDGAGEL